MPPLYYLSVIYLFDLMTLLQILPDEIFVMILSEWIDSYFDVCSLDSAICHREWRKRYLCWLRSSKQTHIEFEITTNEYQQEIYDNMFRWMSLRDYFITNCQCVINHFKQDDDTDMGRNEENNPILSCLSKFPMDYLNILTINTFGINIFFSMDYLLPLKSRYPFLHTIHLKTSYCRMSSPTLPTHPTASTTISSDQITPYTLLSLSMLPRTSFSSYPLTTLELDRISFTTSEWTCFWYLLSHHTTKQITSIQLDNCEGLSYPILYNILLCFPMLHTFECKHSLEDFSIHSEQITTLFLNHFSSPSKQSQESNISSQVGKYVKILRLHALSNPSEVNDQGLNEQQPPQIQRSYNSAYNAFVLNVLSLTNRVEELELHDVNLAGGSSPRNNDALFDTTFNLLTTESNRYSINDTFLVSMLEDIITTNWNHLKKLYLENCNIFARDTMHRRQPERFVDETVDQITNEFNVKPLIHFLSRTCAGELSELGIYCKRQYPAMWNDYCTKELVAGVEDGKCLWQKLQRVEWFFINDLTDDAINAICQAYDEDHSTTPPRQCAINTITIVVCPSITCWGYIQMVIRFGIQLKSLDFTFSEHTRGHVSALYRIIGGVFMPLLENLILITYPSNWTEDDIVHDENVDEFMKPFHFQYPRLQSLHLENVPINTVSTQRILNTSPELTSMSILYSAGGINENELDYSNNTLLSFSKVLFCEYSSVM
jgi:hypothetical protein